MPDIRFVMLVVNRQQEGQFARFLAQTGVDCLLSVPGEGTTAHEVLHMLGLEATEKAVLFTVAVRETERRLLHGLVHQMGLDMPNGGICVSLPLNAMGGASALKWLVGSQLQDKVIEGGEGKPMNETPYSLVCVIANRGCTDQVMEAARGAGATGGTVLHAKGSTAVAEKFFGMSIVDEKEMVLIVAPKPQAADIMRAIMARCGTGTKAHAICFSLPVDAVAGLSAAAAFPD